MKSTKPLTAYHEKAIGKTLFRVTTIYKGEIDFKKAIEDAVIKKIVNEVCYGKAKRQQGL